MKNIVFSIFGILFLYKNTFADGGVTGLPEERLRTGDLHIEDIPTVILNMINFGIYIAGSIAVIFIIIGAYKILFGSISQDMSKGKDTIVMAIIGLIIATLAWFIINFIMSNI